MLTQIVSLVVNFLELEHGEDYVVSPVLTVDAVIKVGLMFTALVKLHSWEAIMSLGV